MAKKLAILLPIFLGLFLLLMVSTSNATTYSGFGTHFVKKGDIIIFDNNSITITDISFGEKPTVSFNIFIEFYNYSLNASFAKGTGWGYLFPEGYKGKQFDLKIGTVNEANEIIALIVEESAHKESAFNYDNYIDAPPEEFASAYLEYARNRGIDINKEFIDVVVDTEFIISNLTIIPSVGIEQDLHDFIRDKPADSRVPIILQFSRSYSLKEFIDLYSEGEIKYYGRTELGKSTFVTSAPVEKIDSLAGLDYIKWVGLYKPSYKYYEVPSSDDKEPAVIRVLGKSNEIYENDLKKFNIEISSSTETLYFVKIAAQEYPKIANLLWVASINYVGNASTSLLSERASAYSGYTGSLESALGSSRNYTNIMIIGIIVLLVVLMLFFAIKFVKIITLLLILIIVVIAGFAGYKIYNNYVMNSVSLEEMKYCNFDTDCVPVDCICSCGGCGGFSYDDIVNKKYEDAWYHQQDCSPAQICPLVCCPPLTTACENNTCVVKTTSP